MQRHKRLICRLLLTVTALAMSHWVAAQEQNITLPKRQLTSKEVFSAIQKQTSYGIAVNESRFPMEHKVKITQSPIRVSSLLTMLLKGTGMTYLLNGNVIVIYNDDRKAPDVIATATEKVVTTPTARPVVIDRTADRIEESAPQPVKTTAYFVPVAVDSTIRTFNNEPKTEYSFVPSAHIRPNYLPKAAIKTNLLIAATTTPNIGAEFGLARKWTLDLTLAYNPFMLQKGGINKVGFVQPELRYWFCQRFEKHFIGLHGLYGRFNIGEVDFLTTTFEQKRYKGWGAGAGISYGYHLPIAKRWAMEFTAGAGYVYLEYDKFRCYACDEFLGKRNRHYLGPTKAGISLMYFFR